MQASAWSTEAEHHACSIVCKFFLKSIVHQTFARQTTLFFHVEAGFNSYGRCYRTLLRTAKTAIEPQKKGNQGAIICLTFVPLMW
jgi:hypothetical protein